MFPISVNVFRETESDALPVQLGFTVMARAVFPGILPVVEEAFFVTWMIYFLTLLFGFGGVVVGFLEVCRAKDGGRRRGRFDCGCW